jgi:hypothetical protein
MCSLDIALVVERQLRQQPVAGGVSVQGWARACSRAGTRIFYHSIAVDRLSALAAARCQRRDHGE